MSDRKPKHLIRLDIDRFKGISARTIDAQGHHVLIQGDNALGKSSCIDALIFGLRGVARGQDNPVMLGERSGSVTISLGSDQLCDLVVTRSITAAGKSKLSIQGSDENGFPLDNSQSVLDALLGKYMLNPVAFLFKRPLEQADDLLASCEIEAPIKEVEALTKVPTPKKESETPLGYLMRLSADKTGEYYIHRLQAGRVLEQKKGALEEQVEIFEAMVPAQAPEPTVELVKKLEGYTQQAEEKRRLEAVAVQAGVSLMLSQQSLKAAEKVLAAIDQEIADLEVKLAQARAKRAAQLIAIDDGAASVFDRNTELLDASEAFEAAHDPQSEIAEVRQQIVGAEVQYAAHIAWKNAQTMVDRLQCEYDAAEQGKKSYDDILAGLRNLRKALLENLDLGISGLEATEDGLTIKDIPFAACSMSQRLRVACAVAMRQQPQLKLLLVDEGERLGETSKNLLIDLADEYGWQVVLTSVSKDPQLCVEILAV